MTLCRFTPSLFQSTRLREARPAAEVASTYVVVVSIHAPA
ncbi:hypothetical protein RNAN_3591 [Rheinheimera nanhaiensis E407-8]|uniref:Uncharacterized protein n=1 Tax=Rheinheimera nanhaiensis E407-8 TaxID=562729 RepID=I1E2N8_9GAMM|nr:hypothetical protein RNAN_3591 [Rheinheimera nanhaiensis E407-8]